MDPAGSIKIHGDPFESTFSLLGRGYGRILAEVLETASVFHFTPWFHFDTHQKKMND